MSWGKQPLPTNWASITHHILRRDAHLCYIQSGDCTQHATEVDHIIPRAEGGSDHPTNLAAVCATCHAFKTKQERLRGIARRPRARRPPESHPGLA